MNFKKFVTKHFVFGNRGLYIILNKNLESNKVLGKFLPRIQLLGGRFSFRTKCKILFQ